MCRLFCGGRQISLDLNRVRGDNMSSVMEARKAGRRMVQDRGPITIPTFSQGVSGVYHYFGTKAEPGPVSSRMDGPAMHVLSVK